MSNSLVRKSLELSGYEDFRKEKKKKKYNGYKGALEFIPAKHRILSPKEKTSIVTQMNFFLNRLRIGGDINTGWGRCSKATVYEARKQLGLKQDNTEENVQSLLLLSNNRIDRKTVDKVLKRAAKKRHVPKEKKNIKKESTVFTEEDFKKFEEEYVEQ